MFGAHGCCHEAGHAAAATQLQHAPTRDGAGHCRMLQRARHHDARWPDGDLVEIEPAAVATALLERIDTEKGAVMVKALVKEKEGHWYPEPEEDVLCADKDPPKRTETNDLFIPLHIT